VTSSAKGIKSKKLKTNGRETRPWCTGKARVHPRTDHKGPEGE